MITRTMVLWCPDWPIIAAVRAHDVPRDAPIAVIDRGLVFACSAAARREGVKRGLRLREAQARCPQLLVFGYEASLDHRSFEPIVSAIEEVVPSVQLLRPGTCAIRSRGPSRYYGSEEEAALWLLDVLDAQGVPDARVGVADGPFTAERAARSTLGRTLGHGTRIRIVPEGQSARFLGPLPIGLLEDGRRARRRAIARQGQAPDLVPLLRRLGVRTLADFAALPADDVLGRFGAAGAHLHALAAGLDSRAVVPREPPEELDCVVGVRTGAGPRRPGDLRHPRAGRPVPREAHGGEAGVHRHPSWRSCRSPGGSRSAAGCIRGRSPPPTSSTGCAGSCRAPTARTARWTRSVEPGAGEPGERRRHRQPRRGALGRRAG